jgi:hypothetical protein
MHYVLVLLVTLFLLAPAAAAGQGAATLEPGTRVLVVLARQSSSLWSRPQMLQGTVTALNVDSISLRLDAEASTVTVATASIAQMAVSRGVPSRLESAVWQGAVLGLQGVSLWPAVRDLNNSDSWSRDVLVGAAVGATIGAIVGALEPREQWRRARKGPEPGEFTVPEPTPKPRVALGGGMALLGAGEISGVGQHVQATMRLTPRGSLLHLRGELLYGSATGSGSPFACERVPTIYCLGRADQTHQYGGGVSVVGDAPFTWGPFQPYGIPLGIGVYHRQTHSTESQGPTTICLIGGELVSCPNNPPFETFRYTTRTAGFGVNIGAGLRTRVGDAQLFAEVRAHTILERGGYSGSAPLTFGIAF